MSETKDLLRRGGEGFAPREGIMDALIRRRDRKRRNQRIAAGVVGITVFVAAIWIVTSVGSLDRSETPAVPGPADTGPAETGPTETGPATAAASAAPDVVKQRTCSDGARWRLEVTDFGDRIKWRFEVHQSPVGHQWRIQFRHKSHSITTVYGDVFFRGTRVASDSGVLVVQRRIRAPAHGPDGVDGRAVDRQTGQVCEASAWYR